MENKICDYCKEIVDYRPLEVVPTKNMERDLYIFCNRYCCEEFFGDNTPFERMRCHTCGCIYEAEECPVCKLRNEIPDMLDDLYNRIKERGNWDPEY